MPFELLDGLTWPAEGVSLSVETAYEANVDLSHLSATNNTAILSLVASDYTAGAIVTLIIEDNAGIEHALYIPVVDTGDGTCTVTMSSLPSSAAAAHLSILSPTAMSISSLALTIPENPLVLLENQVPATFYNSNSSTITINQNTGTICGLMFNVSAATIITGFLLFNYTATDDAVISLDLVADSTAQFYSPLSLSIYAGWHTLHIPVAYVNIAAGTVACVVTAVVDTGSLTVVANQLIFTLTGSNITLYS